MPGRGRESYRRTSLAQPLPRSKRAPIRRRDVNPLASPSTPTTDSNHAAATIMLGHLTRRHVLAANRQWLSAAVARRSYASALGSAIKISSVPAPHAGTITVLSLDRPKARNAISTQLLSELNGVVEGLHKEKGEGSTRALIIASESDDAFCAGADLKERLSMSPEE